MRDRGSGDGRGGQRGWKGAQRGDGKVKKRLVWNGY